jgi:hypothetical protein
MRRRRQRRRRRRSPGPLRPGHYDPLRQRNKLERGVVVGVRLVAGFKIMHLPHQPPDSRVRYVDCLAAALSKDTANAMLVH